MLFFLFINKIAISFRKGLNLKKAILVPILDLQFSFPTIGFQHYKTRENVPNIINNGGKNIFWRPEFCQQLCKKSR